MKKIFYVLIVFLTNIYLTTASLKKSMLPNNNTIWISWKWTDSLNQVFIYAKNFLFAVLWLIAVWVFLFFWFKLISAKWDPEELKKVLMWFVYAIVWLAVIPLAWWIVKLVASLNF